MDNTTLTQLLEVAVSGIVTLVATFAGAWYAFRLTDRDHARRTTKQQVAAVNRAQFVLIQQLNALKQLQNQVINPMRLHPGRAVAMRPTLPVSGPAARLDPESLTFLLETDDRELLFRLLIEQERFDSAIQAFNERSRLHVDVVQPRLAAGGIVEGADYSRVAVATAVGEDVLLRLERATDAAIDHADATAQSCPDLISEFHRAMKSRFPEHVIIRLAQVQPSNKPLQPTSGGLG